MVLFVTYLFCVLDDIMMRFLMTDMKMLYDESEDLLMDLWDMITMEDDPHGVMQWFWDQFEFENEAQIKIRCSYERL